MISDQNPGSNAFSRLKMPKNNSIADNFLIQYFLHTSVIESTLTILARSDDTSSSSVREALTVSDNALSQEKFEVGSGERKVFSLFNLLLCIALNFTP